MSNQLTFPMRFLAAENIVSDVVRAELVRIFSVLLALLPNSDCFVDWRPIFEISTQQDLVLAKLSLECVLFGGARETFVMEIIMTTNCVLQSYCMVRSETAPVDVD